jgi:ATP-dependent Clp protease ATP-binding subunit ClpC
MQQHLDILTIQAKDVTKRAYEIVQKYQHREADTEHFLLAILEQPDNIVSDILKHFSVTQNDLSSQLEQVLLILPKRKIFDKIFTKKGQVFVTKRFMKVFKAAVSEIIRTGNKSVDVEHLFLAICSEQNTPVAKILQDAGLSKDKVIEVMEGLSSTRE